MPCCLSLSLELNSFEILCEKDSNFDYSIEHLISRYKWVAKQRVHRVDWAIHLHIQARLMLHGGYTAGAWNLNQSIAGRLRRVFKKMGSLFPSVPIPCLARRGKRQASPINAKWSYLEVALAYILLHLWIHNRCFGQVQVFHQSCLLLAEKWQYQLFYYKKTI